MSPGAEGQGDYVQRLVRLGGHLVGPSGSGDDSVLVVAPDGTELVVHRV